MSAGRSRSFAWRRPPGRGKAIARTEHLPVDKATYDLCLHLDRVVRGFPRYHKYSLGADLREAARRSLRLVVRANSRREKAPVLLELREELEEPRALLRLAHDVQALPKLASFQHAVTLVVEIARQNEGSLKHQRSGHGQSWPAMPAGLARPSAP